MIHPEICVEAVINRQKNIKPALVKKAEMTAAVRRFFHEKGFLEVDTPVRIPAPAPEAHIDAVSSEDAYLQTSPELCMKRLLAAGYERIYQICKCFRKGERGARHLPELTLLEWYGAQMDYLKMMDMTADLIRFAAKTLGLGETLTYKNRTADISLPWIVITVDEAFRRFSSVDIKEALLKDTFDEIIAFEVEPVLSGMEKPVFLCDYPLEKGALAVEKKCAPGSLRVVERFELYMFGIELCNAFSELTDPDIQKKRFVEELKYREMSGKTVTPMPQPFIDSLKYMPKASGNALGMDRLAMILTGAETIDEVSAFVPEEL